MKTIIQSQIIQLLCDECKKDCSKEGFCCIIDFDFGYGTGRDGESGKFELCNNCAEEFLKKFKKSYNFVLKYKMPF